MNWDIPKTYAVKHIDSNVVEASRSGGIFTAISDYILENNGVVYGCVLTEDLKVIHARAENSLVRDKMRGSKYVQSHLGSIFKDVKNDLNMNKKVLFSGTSCQIKGLRNFLNGTNDKNLICVDIVCHGVPSPLIWKKYIEWHEKKAGCKVTDVNFRNKKEFGWRDHVETLKLESDKTINSTVFTRLFYKHDILRPCCYECPFKSVIHPGDITIADYWGIEKACPELDDNKGVSLVLINNSKGDEIFNKVKKQLVWKKTKIEDSMQPPLISPFPIPKSRTQFWNDFESTDFRYIVKKYGKEDLKKRVLSTLVLIKRKLIK
ncbi:Coenzyme F420 hydrogenase/dehydrogenase, beta subunit C-terminal domain [Longibaculum muris]|uniref:Coenzyme F420 hydrogenase/dehydrogenase, beta subunit C-terminal domain n=1 Tax=Longibaculum muris TaxID=1796628 RepID=UPI00189F5457|nr:Coenzyme F420 hydrogenase/dehydrogenase, beta subunit C-terminal domain [Longibaculum muris]